ncbi:hypothetical protein B0J11DRAFT_542097 [Dendryphion nanum]|uniref:FAD/NAD(P)-binding domain-containing protein n=1 Tax=Dendryphion nanum TaxID=256645 RepID=A0A9P9D5N9_9PLEO|nr:hypothetical protein B0J11DRAFT_542097 [Dendryphion nanum]
MAPKVIIVGAGWAGLVAARSYIAINSNVDLTILDDGSTVGGVWSVSRIYPGLVADSPRGLFEYSDLSMLDEDVFASNQKAQAEKRAGQQHVQAIETEQTLDTKKRYGPIRGEEIHNYLHKYAEKYDLLRRIKFQSRVVKAERIRRSDASPDGWRLTMSSGEEMECNKLIIASGLFSQPFTPKVPGLTSFSGLSIHSQDLGQQHPRLSDPSIESVTIVGSCKSAVEAINLCLALPTKPHINWVMRGGEHGVPILLSNPESPVPIVAANNLRVFSAVSPSIFDTESGLYNFFHSGRSWIGPRIVKAFFKLLGWAIISGAGYDKSEQGRLIKPVPEKMFRFLLYTCLILKGNPVLEEIHKGERVKVHIGEISGISASGIALRSNESQKEDNHGESKSEIHEIKTDAIIWCTGFKSSATFFNAEDTHDLGLPVAINSLTPEEKQHWETLDINADKEVVSKLPWLGQWPIDERHSNDTYYRMYRYILSPELISRNDRTIMFAGFVASGNTALTCELISIWGIAWLEGLLKQDDLPSKEEMEFAIAKTQIWSERRHGGKANNNPKIVAEAQGYIDALVRDLGAKVHRRGGWKEYIGIYQPSDYKGLVYEVIECAKQRRAL